MTDPARDEVARRLESMGYDCVPVPETPDHKTADLCARHETGDLLIEVKSRVDDELMHAEILRAPRKPVWDAQSQNTSSAIDGDLRTAREQLTQTGEEFQGVWGVWWIPAPRSQPTIAPEQIRGMLLGIRQGFRSEGEPMSDCYYAGPTAFWKFREIAFAVVGDELIVNEFCQRAEQFRASHLYWSFPGNVLDLALLRSTVEAPIVRGGHRRTDEVASLAALQELHPEFEGFMDVHVFRGFAPLQGPTEDED